MHEYAECRFAAQFVKKTDGDKILTKFSDCSAQKLNFHETRFICYLNSSWTIKQCAIFSYWEFCLGKLILKAE